MQQVIINSHVSEDRNVGDLVSSPLRYFQFPGFDTLTLDIRNFDQVAAGESSSTLQSLQQTAEQIRCHAIVGGGGLLSQRFRRCFEQLNQSKSIIRGRRIAWGIGQQRYGSEQISHRHLAASLAAASQEFSYSDYLDRFDLIGIRDYGVVDTSQSDRYQWVPCASCMHPAFDRDYPIEHEFVVFSHKKFRIRIDRLPHLTNETMDFESILAFLGSGETILTSSFHGAYWGLLLGRKVLAFPFSTKFATFKHQPAYYPLLGWRAPVWKFRPFRRSFLNKLSFEWRYGNKYSCATQDWQLALQDCQVYPGLLAAYRERNRDYYQQVLALLSDV